MKIINKYFLLILSISGSACSEETIDCAKAFTTVEVNICSKRNVDLAQKNLDAYYLKAQERFNEEKNTIDSLKKSQQAWLAYREIYCDAVYERWSEGTIRGEMYNNCMLTLTKQRTHQIWEDYLQYMDSTPPLLPKPE